MATDAFSGLPKAHEVTSSQRLVIVASSLGTVFEWYDFFVYGLLATYITTKFFSGVNETTGFILALGAFAAGFAVRPFGALVFGRIGDMVGRKNTFLVTIIIMGLSTFAVGLLPTYAQIGVTAPILLVLLRMLQGLALGGEYGGAATYVAEHAPAGKRGLYTSFIQTTATLGLFAALLIVIALRTGLTEPVFADWGWRLPFLISAILLAVSVWIRLQLNESPIFRAMKEAGTTSKAPLSEAFGKWGNLKYVLIALFGAAAGQGVVWYTGQFYALFFLEKTLKVEGATTNILIAIALLIATPAFVFFGWLSDKIGRKPILLVGCAVAALSYFPLFTALTEAANPALAAALAASPVHVTADPATCSFQFDPVGKNKFDGSGCDVAKAYLAKAGVTYTNTAAAAGAPAAVEIGGTGAAGAGGRDARGQGAGGGDQGLSGDAEVGAGRGRLSGQGRPGEDRQAACRADPRRARPAGDRGLRPDRGDARRAVPQPHPLHVDVAALSHRQRLVRRLPADDGVRDGRGDGQYLLRPVVPDRRRGGDGRHRPVLPARDVQAVADRLSRATSRHRRPSIPTTSSHRVSEISPMPSQVKAIDATRCGRPGASRGA